MYIFKGGERLKNDEPFIQSIPERLIERDVFSFTDVSSFLSLAKGVRRVKENEIKDEPFLDPFFLQDVEQKFEYSREGFFIFLKNRRRKKK